MGEAWFVPPTIVRSRLSRARHLHEPATLRHSKDTRGRRSAVAAAIASTASKPPSKNSDSWSSDALSDRQFEVWDVLPKRKQQRLLAIRRQVADSRLGVMIWRARNFWVHLGLVSSSLGFLDSCQAMLKADD